MLKIETRPGCTRTNGCGSAQEMNKNSRKKNASRLGQGLNVTVNVSFWFCNDDVNKNQKSKNMIFVVFL